MPARGLLLTVLGVVAIATLAALLIRGARFVESNLRRPDAPDIELAWAGSGILEPLEGRPGDQVVLGFRLHNSGRRAAYGATVHSTATLGPAQEPVRFIPGPDPGKDLYGTTRFALAEGRSEICLEARLLRRARADAHERRLDNNRICRAIRTQPSSNAAAAPPEEDRKPTLEPNHEKEKP